jgi:hypothetical protein
MTMHDDRNLRLLEDDLRKLAEPREEDEALRLAVRDQLSVRSRHQPPRRLSARRLSTRLAAGATAAVAAVAVAVVALVGSSGSGGPSVADAAIVHHALMALTAPANSILHAKIVGTENGVTVEAEAWLQTSPPYASRALEGVPGRQWESGYDGTTDFSYDPHNNTIYETPHQPRQVFVDPVAEVRQALADGKAQVRGTVTIDGGPLYQIDLWDGAIGYFDENNFEIRYVDLPQPDGTVVRLQVVAYDYLPVTTSMASRLSVTAQLPGARIVVGPPPPAINGHGLTG